MRWPVFLFGALLPALVLAAPRDATIAAGDCRDPDLIGVTRDLVRVLGTRPSEQVVPLEEISQKLAPTSTRSVEELKRQLDGATMQFYTGRYGTAERQFQEASAQIGRLPPGKQQVELLTQLNLVYSLLLSQTGRQEQGDELQRQILRLQPDYRMDPDYFSPLTRRRFERLRAQLAKGKRERLILKSLPEGAEVSLDGKSVGKTPLTLELPPGVYGLRLSRDGALSFPHTVDLHSTQALVVDMAFEGSVHAQRIPCLEHPANEEDRLSKAARLGNLVGADQAVVVRLGQRGGGPTWLTATLVGLPAGEEIREGSLKLEDPNQPAKGLEDLVTFLLTGQPAGNVVAGPVRGPRMARRPSDAPGAQPALTPSALPEENVLTRSEASAGWHWKRKAAYGASGLGAVLLGVGTAMELSSAGAWSDFDGYYSGGKSPSLAQVPQVASLRDSAQVKQQVGATLLVSGAVALGAGLYLYFTSQPGE